MESRCVFIAFCWSTSLLVGCGGSGSAPSAPAAGTMSLSSVAGATAMASYLQGAHKHTLKASSGGNNYTLQVSTAPNSATTNFNGSAPAYSSVDSATLDENGVVLATNVSTEYYLVSPYVPLGRVAAGGSPYGVVTSSTPLPAMLVVGSSGDLDSLTWYHDSTASTVDGDEGVSYSVKANNATTVLFCVDSSITNVTPQGTADDLVDDAQTDCYTMDAAGSADLVSVTLTVNGLTMTFE